MKAVITIIKKEFRRFFGDPRLLLTTIFLPGLVLFAVYSALGAVFNNLLVDDSVPIAYVRNMPQSLSSAINSAFEVKELSVSDDEAKDTVREGDVDIFVVFPEDFDSLTVS